MQRKLSAERVLADLRKRIARTSLRKVAVELEVSPAYLSDVMAGKRSVAKKLCEGLGLKRSITVKKTVTFERVA